MSDNAQNANDSGNAAKSRKKRTLSSFSILLIMLVVLAGVTVAMAGAGAEGVTGATVADVATAPVRGFADALPVCLFVLILGGFLGIVTETGALDAGIAALVRRLKGNELVLIPLLMFVFSIGGTTFGMWEETVPFYLLLAATMVAAGFDSLVGVAVVLLGAGCGVLGSTVNPFAVGAAIDALSGTGLAVNQGVVIGLGVVLWLVTLALSIAFVMRYARRVKADKGSTILSLQEREAMEAEFGAAQREGGGGEGFPSNARSNARQEGQAPNDGVGEPSGRARALPLPQSTTTDALECGGKERPREKPLTTRQKGVLVAFGFTFVVMIVGFVPWEDFGIEVFDIGVATEQQTGDVSGDGIAAMWEDAEGAEPAFDGEAGGTATSEEQSSQGWSAFLTGLPLGQWYFDEASTWFLVMALVIGVVGGLSESRFVKAFVDGAASMMSVVLVIALARSVTVLMGETGLDLWILENAAQALAGVSAVVFAPLSFLLYAALSFLVPSSSGMATVSLPIMGPLADQLGFSVEAMIMVFCAGNGLVNLFTPTSGAIMGGLALAKVEYATWLKFGAALFAVLALACAVVLTAAMLLVPA